MTQAAAINQYQHRGLQSGKPQVDVREWIKQFDDEYCKQVRVRGEFVMNVFDPPMEGFNIEGAYHLKFLGSAPAWGKWKFADRNGKQVSLSVKESLYSHLSKGKTYIISLRNYSVTDIHFCTTTQKPITTN